MKKLKFLFFLYLIFAFSLYAQNDDHFNHSVTTDYIAISNKIFNDNIKTVMLHRDGWELSPPLLKFNSSEKLKLSFDDLEADGKEYMFTIIHCNANWKPSELKPYEYIDGYEEDYINQYAFSMNTIVPFTHYELLFPTDDLKPRISGNYVMKVFVENSENIYFTRRFTVVDQQVSITGNVKRATTSRDRNYKQEVDFEIDANSYRVSNPYQDLKVVVTQNGRWDNAIFSLKPKMVIGSKYNYDYDSENVFDGGNEFRAINIKSLNYYTENIRKIEFTAEGYQVYLKTDEKRTFKIYKTEDDINGQFTIKTEDQKRTETESEYVNIHFNLPYQAPLPESGLYIFGALTDWNLDSTNKMDYDYKTQAYVKTMLLKQGYYDYQYMMKYDNETKGDISFIEGNHWETDNEYTIYVYNREMGNPYDKLIGVTHIHSFDK